MSFNPETFLDDLLGDAKAAMAIASPLISIAKTAAPEVAAIFPSTAPVIAGAEAGAALINQVAPTAINDTMALITEGKQILADLGPAGTRLSTIFGSLFGKTNAGQATVLVPVTTAPTVPAPVPAGAIA